MNTQSAPMPWRGHFKATLTLGLPIIGAHLAQLAVGMTDTVMVGWYGVTQLAAVTLATSVFFIFFIVGSGFAMAVMPMVATASGEGDERQVRRITRMGLWISLVYCALLMPVLWNYQALMLLMGQKSEIAALGQDYMRIAQWGMIPMMLVMVLKSMLSALERPNWVLWGTIIGALANALFDWVLIFGHWGAPELGVRGAAIASVGTSSIVFLVLAAYTTMQRDLSRFTIFSRLWRPDWPAFAEVFRLGWPIGLTMLAEVGLFSTSALMMGWLGTRELATHGIVIQIATFSFMIYLGLANVATIRVGRALGRRDGIGLWRAAMMVTILQLGLSALFSLVFLLAPEPLIRLFLDSDKPASAEIVAYGRGLLVLAALFQVFDGLQVVYLWILRGLKDTRVPMIGAVIAYWAVGVAASYGLAFRLGFGGYGVWAGLVIGLSLASAFMVLRFVAIYRRAMARG
ncbi:MAG: MATE family efflux transporter [Paracoccaceae bacterium]|nr:MATE family efflux transporter [Paracoccaceae bacterium]